MFDPVQLENESESKSDPCPFSNTKFVYKLMNFLNAFKTLRSFQ